MTVSNNNLELSERMEKTANTGNKGENRWSCMIEQEREDSL